MRFKAHFTRRKSAPFISPLPPSRKGSVSVSVYAEPVSQTTTNTTTIAESTPHRPSAAMSGRDSTISMSDASLAGARNGRDTSTARYVRRPNLAQILADEAPPPWTLEAFTAYAARNLCLENIEFIQDARRYKMAYRAVIGAQDDGQDIQGNDRPALSRMNSAQSEKLKELWTRLMINYIAPSSAKEINLTADIRAGLLPHNKQLLPPNPQLLDPAIKKIEELIEDSILFSFLNEVHASAGPSLYQPSITSQERLALETGFQPGDKFSHASSVQEMLSPMSEAPRGPFSPSGRSPRSSHHFGFHHHSGRPSSHKGSAASTTNSAMPGSAAVSLAPTLSEDSSSIISPVASQQDQKSPPRTPPSNEAEPIKRSPKQHDRWKRMSQRFGFNRKSGTALKDVQEDQYPPMP